VGYIKGNVLLCCHEFNHPLAQWSASLATTIRERLMKPHMRRSGMAEQAREKLDGVLDDYSKGGADCAQHVGETMIRPLLDWANGTKESTKERVEELKRLLQHAEEHHKRHTTMAGRREIELRELEAAAKAADAKAKQAAAQVVAAKAAAEAKVRSQANSAAAAITSAASSASGLTQSGCAKLAKGLRIQLSDGKVGAIESIGDRGTFKVRLDCEGETEGKLVGARNSKSPRWTLLEPTSSSAAKPAKGKTAKAKADKGKADKGNAAKTNADDELKKRVEFKNKTSSVKTAINKWVLAGKKQGEFSVSNLKVVVAFIGAHFNNSRGKLYEQSVVTKGSNWRETVGKVVKRHIVVAKREVDSGIGRAARHSFSAAMDVYMQEFYLKNRKLWPVKGYFKALSAPGEPSLKTALDAFFTQLARESDDRKKELFPDDNDGSLWNTYTDVESGTLMVHKWVKREGTGNDGSLRVYVAHQFHGRCDALRKLLAQRTSTTSGSKRKAAEIDDPSQSSAAKQPRAAAVAAKASLKRTSEEADDSEDEAQAEAGRTDSDGRDDKRSRH